jgi:hypothetical protein
MNINFLQDRAATIGEKLDVALDAGRIPSNADVAFFDKCMADLTKVAPAHGLRVVAIQFHAKLAEAKAKRALWIAGRDAALKAAAQRKAAAKRPVNNKTVRAVIAEVKSTTTVPTGPTKQGLDFVVELPLEWQDDKKIVVA